MSEASLVPLGEVAEFVNGAAFKPTDWEEFGRPIIRIQNLTDSTRPYNRTTRVVSPKLLVQPGDLLVSWSATLGVFDWSGSEEAVLNQHIFRVLPDGSRIDKSYLRHVLSGALVEMTRHLHGATMQHVNRSEFLGTPIRLPLLEEQRRIAEVLDRADALRAKRGEALALLDDLTQSIFLALFGPARDRRRWSIATLGELLAGIDSGKSPVCLSRQANDGEWGVLKLGAVSRRRYLPEQNKALPEGVKPAVGDEVKADDLLMARKNTLDLVGACALVGSTPPRLLLPDLIFRLRLRDQVPVRKRYLHRALCQDDVRAQIRSLAGGSAGSMPNISKARLSTVRLLIPPTELQDAFGARVELVEEEKAMQSLHLDQIDALFWSLQQRAFAGEL